MNNEFNYDHTDCYFLKAKAAADAANVNPLCVWQIFQKRDSIFCGLPLVKAKGLFDNATELLALPEGAEQQPFEPSIIFKAPFQDMVEFETLYLGIIARCTLVATNVRKVVQAANGKPVLFFPARFDIPETQYYDGYAAAVGGVAGCATAEQTRGFNLYRFRHGLSRKDPVGTMPHALIAAFNGDTAAATWAFAKARPDEQVWSLVDFHNDCAKTSVEVARAMEAAGMLDSFAGVRLDTSEKLADKGLADLVAREGMQNYTGVCPALVRHVRQELDLAGFPKVKIAVSGGFSAEKIAYFEATGVPADVYAVGESLIRGANPYTSDIVARLDGTRLVPCGKVGRELKATTRLHTLKGLSIPA